MSRVRLVLQRSAEQQAAFDRFVASQYEAGSTNFHRWLEPEEDLAVLTSQVYRPDLLAPAVEAERLYPVTNLPALESSAMLPHLHEPVFSGGWRRN